MVTTAMITGWFWNEMVFDKLEKMLQYFKAISLGQMK